VQPGRGITRMQKWKKLWVSLCSIGLPRRVVPTAFGARYVETEVLAIFNETSGAALRRDRIPVRPPTIGGKNWAGSENATAPIVVGDIRQ